MRKEKKTIVFFSEQKGGNKSCPINSEKAKELHSCPYREELYNDNETLCDCGEEATHQCAMDI